MNNLNGSSHRPGAEDERDDFRARHPGLAEITYAEDDTSFRARLRRHFRNPPMLTILLVLLIVLAVPIGIAYPKVSNVAKENWSDVQLSRERHFINVTAASWIYPFLRRQAERMQHAEIPIDWRPVSFKTGPCLASHMTELPVGKYTYAIETACKSLDEIQMKYVADCAETAACNIPEQAVIELQVVLDRLKVAFSDANLVEPYSKDQAGSSD